MVGARSARAICVRLQVMLGARQPQMALQRPHLEQTMSFSEFWRRPSRILALLIAFGSAPNPAIAQAFDKNALLSVHRQLLESVFLRGDTNLIAATALPNLVVVPPGGIVEDRQQLLSGVRNTLSDSLVIDDVVVVDHGTTAVVIARVRVSLQGRQSIGTGRSRMMSVFVYDNHTWRLLARSVTPCIERAVSAGRC